MTPTRCRFYEDSVGLNQLIILPPDINQSFYAFMPTDARHIRYGLGAIKGAGQAAIEAIVAERQVAALLPVSLIFVCGWKNSSSIDARWKR